MEGLGMNLSRSAATSVLVVKSISDSLILEAIANVPRLHEQGMECFLASIAYFRRQRTGFSELYRGLVAATQRRAET
jgi:hypothetical protein